MYSYLVLAGVLTVAVFVHGASEGRDFGHHGYLTISKVLRRFLYSQPEDVKLTEGVHLVNVRSGEGARSVKDDGSVLSAIENYVQDHEIRIRLPELMPGEGFARSFKDALDGFDGNNVGTARGKGDKGGGGSSIMMMGLMMGKMMAALGIGGVGLLAMKALMVSTLALALSGIVGLKKLVSHDEGGHTVIHASHGHEHRRRRDASNMAYQAWNEYDSRQSS